MAAFRFEYAAGHMNLMVELGHFQQVEDGTSATRLGVHTSHNDFRNACLDDRAGTHLAWFQGNIERAVLQTPVAYFFAGFIDRRYFRVCQGIFIRIAAIISPAYDLSVADDHAANRDFPE